MTTFAEGHATNLARNSGGAVVDNLDGASPSSQGYRPEYAYFDMGNSLSFEGSVRLTVSFDLVMTVAKANPALTVYNTNNKGPMQFGSVNALSGETHAAGETIEKRVAVTASWSPRSDANRQTNYLEFYSTYGTGNYFSISNLMVELGDVAHPWSPSPLDEGVTGMIKASAEVTVYDQTDVVGIAQWHFATTSTTVPSKPATTDASATPSGWSRTEPTITSDSDLDKYVYVCVQTVWGDGSCTWGSVSMSASFEAAKRAWNKASSAHDIATQVNTEISRTNERIELLAEEVTLKSSGSGTSVVTEGAATAALDALAVYGKSVQDGTPTPSAPVPIQSVESPSVRVTDSGGTVRSTTPIPLSGHELRSLPDGTRDELTVDADGRVTMVQRVTQTSQAVTDGVSGTVGTDVMSSTGAIADGATVLYHGAESVVNLGTIEMPEVRDGDVVEVIASVTPSIDCTWYTSQELADEAARRAASIDLSASGVLSTVADTYATNGQVRDLETQVQQTATSVTMMFNRLVYGKDTLTDEDEQITQTIKQAFDALGVTSENLEELRSFVRLTTDGEDDPYLLMGSANSPVMMALTNSMLEFRHGKERLAYIEVILEGDEFKESRFHIQKAMVDEVLQFGSEKDTNFGGYWQWFERNNGNLALKWVDIPSGGSE